MNCQTCPPPSLAAKAWRAYQCDQAGPDPSFIEQYLPLVKTTVGRMRLTLPATIDTDDLYSVGVTGLMAAAQKFDPAQSGTFTAFASMHIRGAVLDELRRMDWMSRGCREKANRLKQAIIEIEQREGRPATDREIREALSLSEEEYAQFMEETKPISFVSFDGQAYADGAEGMSLSETIPDENQCTGRDTLDKKELLELVKARIAKLPDMPKKILAMYYFEEMRLSEIAAAFGLSEGRISQIHTQAVISIRTFIESTLKNSPARICS